MRRHTLLLLAIGALLTAGLGGCADVAAPTAPASLAATADQAGPEAAVAGADLPAPGATLAASEVPSTPAAVDVAVVAPGTDAGTTAVRAVIDAYVGANGGTSEVFAEASVDDSVAAAIAARPDVVVGVGPEVAASFDVVSASNLDVRFLLLGTQLAEPTSNVVAVVWPGADERAVYADVERGFANVEQHAADAVARGLAAGPAGFSGYVIALP